MLFYGEAKTGKKIHMGNYIVAGRGHASDWGGHASDWVWAFCGADIATWEAGERPPVSRADEFCKNCFRAYAWNIMLAVLVGAGGLPVPAVPELPEHKPTPSQDEYNVIRMERATG